MKLLQNYQMPWSSAYNMLTGSLSLRYTDELFRLATTCAVYPLIKFTERIDYQTKRSERAMNCS